MKIGKKILSTALAGVMTLSLAVPAFAAGEAEAGLDYDFVINTPTVEVEMTSNGGIVLNPYMLSYENPVTGELVEDTDIKSVATAVNVITSRTNAPLDVDVTITSEAADTVEWGTASVESSTDKKVFLQFALQTTDDPEIEEISVASWTATSAMTSKAALATAKATLVTLDGSEQVQGEDTHYFVMLPAEDAETPAYAAFQLVGDVSTKSTEVWTADDFVTASVAFTFNVMSNAELSA